MMDYSSFLDSCLVKSCLALGAPCWTPKRTFKLPPIITKLLDSTDRNSRPKDGPPRTPAPLPELPTAASLPTEEIDDFISTLESAVYELQHDFTSGARQLADASLSHLAHITDIAACTAVTWAEFWAMMVHAAKKLSNARPSMSAAITSCLLRALERIARYWNEEEAKGRQSTSEFARIAGGTFDQIREERKEITTHLGGSFTDWLRQQNNKVPYH
jgi:hypothetical protein